jgi:hypothetical protein
LRFVERMDSLNLSIGNFMKIRTCIGCMNKHENMYFDLARWILKTLVFFYLLFLIQFHLVYYLKNLKKLELG